MTAVVAERDHVARFTTVGTMPLMLRVIRVRLTGRSRKAVLAERHDHSTVTL